MKQIIYTVLFLVAIGLTGCQKAEYLLFNDIARVQMDEPSRLLWRSAPGLLTTPDAPGGTRQSRNGRCGSVTARDRSGAAGHEQEARWRQ